MKVSSRGPVDPTTHADDRRVHHDRVEARPTSARSAGAVGLRVAQPRAHGADRTARADGDDRAPRPGLGGRGVECARRPGRGSRRTTRGSRRRARRRSTARWPARRARWNSRRSRPSDALAVGGDHAEVVELVPAGVDTGVERPARALDHRLGRLAVPAHAAAHDRGRASAPARRASGPAAGPAASPSRTGRRSRRRRTTPARDGPAAAHPCRNLDADPLRLSGGSTTVRAGRVRRERAALGSQVAQVRRGVEPLAVLLGQLVGAGDEGAEADLARPAFS